MSFGGHALYAKMVTEANRALRRDVIKDFRNRAKLIRMSTSNSSSAASTFQPKEYSDEEYKEMQNSVRSEVRSDLLIKGVYALVTFITFCTMITLGIKSLQAM